MYVYITYDEGATWLELVKLLASDGAADDWFGYAVAVQNSTIVVGAIDDSDNGGDSGKNIFFYVICTMTRVFVVCYLSQGLFMCSALTIAARRGRSARSCWHRTEPSAIISGSPWRYITTP